MGNAQPGAVIARLTERFSGEATDRLEGFKIIRDNGWVHVRASNTEPIIRCYAEGRTKAEAAELSGMVMDVLRSLV